MYDRDVRVAFPEFPLYFGVEGIRRNGEVASELVVLMEARAARIYGDVKFEFSNFRALCHAVKTRVYIIARMVISEVGFRYISIFNSECACCFEQRRGLTCTRDTDLYL